MYVESMSNEDWRVAAILAAGAQGRRLEKDRQDAQRHDELLKQQKDATGRVVAAQEAAALAAQQQTQQIIELTRRQLEDNARARELAELQAREAVKALQIHQEERQQRTVAERATIHARKILAQASVNVEATIAAEEGKPTVGNRQRLIVEVLVLEAELKGVLKHEAFLKETSDFKELRQVERRLRDYKTAKDFGREELESAEAFFSLALELCQRVRSRADELDRQLTRCLKVGSDMSPKILEAIDKELPQLWQEFRNDLGSLAEEWRQLFTGSFTLADFRRYCQGILGSSAPKRLSEDIDLLGGGGQALAELSRKLERARQSVADSWVNISLALEERRAADIQTKQSKEGAGKAGNKDSAARNLQLAEGSPGVIQGLTFVMLVMAMWNDGAVSPNELANILSTLNALNPGQTNDQAYGIVRSMADCYNAESETERGRRLQFSVQHLTKTLRPDRKAWVLDRLQSLCSVDQATSSQQAEFLKLLRLQW